MPTYDSLKQLDADIHAAVTGEMQGQTEGVELIPSENYISADNFGIIKSGHRPEKIKSRAKGPDSIEII